MADAPPDAAGPPPADAAGPSAPPPARAPRRRANLRRRAGASDDDDDDANDATAVVKRAKGAAGGPLAFSTRGARAAGAPAVAHRYTSDRTLQSGRDDLATAHLQTETEFDRDARAVQEATLATAAAGAAAADDGVYRGARGYVDHTAGFKRELTVASDRGTATGPLRAATALRVTVRVDYAPDICKDYKETGYCGYGDACKFMHDRGDHKAGWQIDKEWEEKQKQEAERKRREDEWAEGGDAKKDDDDDDDGLPFACFICRRPWDAGSDPVVTRCGHYFCEQCALKRHAAAGGGACAACGAATGGTFNVAHAIVRKVKRAQGRG